MTNKETVVGFVLLLIIGGLQFYQNIRQNNQIIEMRELLASHIRGSKDIINLPYGFTYVYERFALYNAKIDTNTVIKYIEVVDAFNMREDTTHFDWLIGQVILESGARQFDNDGDVIRGTSGEVGMTQIMPSTALGLLSEIHDPTVLYDLGASDFSFTSKKSIDKKEKLALTVKWLSKTNNNLILWGFIMSDNMRRNGILKGLVAYNAGIGGMRKFIGLFCKPEEHKYIQGIKDTLQYVSVNI
jgi:hypothetical protein